MTDARQSRVGGETRSRRGPPEKTKFKGNETCSTDVGPLDACSLVSSFDANNSAERLGTLTCNGGINLVSNSLCGLVTKLRGWKPVDQLRGRLCGTAKNDPLQRDNENPFHQLLHSSGRVKDQGSGITLATS